MEFVLFVGVVILFIFVIPLRTRVSYLEEKISRSSSGQRVNADVAEPTHSADVAPATPAQSPAEELIAPIPVSPVAGVSTQELTSDVPWVEQLSVWLREDWLLKLGALLLLIGFGWLATYAFMNNWIGPVGRIVLGILAGLVILVFGWAWMKNHRMQGSVFLVLGATVTILTIFAAREVYDFMTPLSALGVMFLVSVFVALASLKYGVRPLAFVGLALAGIVPLLVNAPVPDYVGLFWYLLIVVLGSVWIVVVRQWKELLLGSLFIVGLYSVPHIVMGGDSVASLLLIFEYVFAAVFFIVPMAAVLRLRSRSEPADIAIGAVNGALLLFWVLAVASRDWQGLILAAWAIVFATGAFLVFRATQNKEIFYIYAGVAVAFLAGATSAQLSGSSLTIAYLFEAVAVIMAVNFVLRDIAVTKAVALLLGVPVVMSGQNMISSSWNKGPIFQKDFFVLLVFSIVFWGLGIFFKRDAVRIAGNSMLHVVFLIGASLYAFILLWLALHAMFWGGYVGIMIALVVYTIVGLIAYAVGRSNDQRMLWMYGSVVLVFVVLRLLVVDVWTMEMTGKIITFFLVGALLVATAFIGRPGADPNKTLP